MYLLALVLSSAVLSLSCAETGGYSTNDGAISSNDLRNDEKLRASMLSDVVEKFWELSLEDNRIKLADFVGETPDEFWTACPPASKSSPQDDSNLSFQKDGGLRGEENEVSKTKSRPKMAIGLLFFADQIAKPKTTQDQDS
ncbi:MAG: hypothetical protein IPN51_12930 [Chloracidobacterium sp.]|nr:hypothetical protein [Chloracidobacterium sp.]